MWIAIAAASGGLAVLLGAFGAHGLASRVGGESLEAWRTATYYHLLHSVALLALASYAGSSGRSITLPAAAWTLDMVLFCGSLYGLVLTGQRWLGPITPLGGLCLILGWFALLPLARG